MSLTARLDARWGRAYFAAQAAAGGAWWVGVSLSPGIRTLTLGDLPAGLVAALDVPLFVFASALAACTVRFAAEVTTAWTVLVTAALTVYATLTGLAGWGALLMIAASVCSIGALLLIRLGRIPSEWLLVGPFRMREAPTATAGTHLRRTAGQVVVFWGACLVLMPAAIAVIEQRWGLRIGFPPAATIAGVGLLLVASALGVWSAVTMARRGDGTPLPVATARLLVVSGPYRFVRNPMAVAGIAQGVAVGLICGSWLVVVYALCGSLVWNDLIRPGEEKDLESRFGAPYVTYRDQVACWVPRRPRRRSSGSAGNPLVY